MILLLLKIFEFQINSEAIRDLTKKPLQTLLSSAFELAVVPRRQFSPFLLRLYSNKPWKLSSCFKREKSINFYFLLSAGFMKTNPSFNFLILSELRLKISLLIAGFYKQKRVLIEFPPNHIDPMNQAWWTERTQTGESENWRKARKLQGQETNYLCSWQS